MTISITAPIDRAIHRTKITLFKPFQAAKWFKLGFCAFLAQLGQGGGSFQFPSIPGPGGGPPTTGLPPNWVEWWTDNAVWMVPLIVLSVLAVVTVAVLVVWLSSRGKFMLLDGLAHNRGAVVEPWKRHAALANNLCGFVLLCILLSFVGLAISAGLGMALAWPDLQAGQFTERGFAAVIVVTALLLLGGLVVMNLFLLLNDFVVPAMYLRGQRVTEAWGTVYREVLCGHLGRIVLFYLMRLVMMLPIGVMTIMAIRATCCLALLPYLGSVILLPFTLFMRSYTLYFLQQFGPQWQFFTHDPGPWFDSPEPGPRCRHCGYNLTGNVSGICPECGSPAPLTPPTIPPSPPT